MSTLTSIPVSNPQRFLTLQEGYKQELMGDLRLEEASALAARRQLLLENKQVSPEWALPQVKAMSRKLHRLTTKIRQPFGTPAHTMFPTDADDPAEALAAGPVQALVQRILQPPTPSPIKTPAQPGPAKRRAPVLTPQLTPSTRKAKKKALLQFRGRTGGPKPKKPKYRPDLGAPIPFNPDTPVGLPTPSTPQGQRHPLLPPTAKSQGKALAKSAGKQAGQKAAKAAGRGLANWLGWTR